MTSCIKTGEVLGLFGDTGAGRSTPITVLSGAVPYSSGEIFFEGQKLRLRDPNDAISAGIETIYQDSALVTQLSIARNLVLGCELRKDPGFLEWMDQDRMSEVAANLLNWVGISKNIQPTTPIGALSGGERQAVTIARAMHLECDLIILDEPTNNLGVAETQGVLRFVREVRDACIFIAHNFHHVFQVLDRMIVMWQGQIAADDLSPKTSTIQDVEDTITGEHLLV